MRSFIPLLFTCFFICGCEKKPAEQAVPEPEISGLRKDIVGKWRLVRAGGKPPIDLYIKSQEIDIAADGTWTSKVEVQPPNSASDRFTGKGKWSLADGVLSYEYADEGGVRIVGSGPDSGKSSVKLESGRLIVDPDCFMQARKNGTDPVAGEYER
jgi:hypothetical protein